MRLWPQKVIDFFETHPQNMKQILRHVEPIKTTDRPIAIGMTKNAERREKFRNIGAAINLSKTGDPNVPDYHTGRPSKFEFKRYDSFNRDTEDLLNRDGEGRTEVPLGPQFRTPQWERTIR